MANNEFKKIDEFIQRFNAPRFCNTIEAIWGIEFCYKNKYYRITRDQSGDDNFTKKIRERFNKPNGKIEFYILPVKKYMDDYDLSVNIYLGVFDDCKDLLNNGNIEGIPLKEILVSEKTRILSID